MTGRARRWISPLLVKGALAGAGAMLALASSAAPTTAAIVPPAGASAPASSTPALTLSAKAQADRPDRLVLTSHLSSAPVPAGTSVNFFVVSKEFGQDREVPIGTADVDRNGSASITYRPTWAGSQKFVVHLAGGSADAGPTGVTTYNVATAAPGPYQALANEPRPFGPMGRVFVEVLLAVVALVWLTLIVTVVRVARGLPKRA